MVFILFNEITIVFLCFYTPLQLLVKLCKTQGIYTIPTVVVVINLHAIK